MTDGRSVREATRLATLGREATRTGRAAAGAEAVNPPVWRASTILFDSVAAMRAASRPDAARTSYALHGLPTTDALADALTALEPGATGTRLYGSGLAAIASVLAALLGPGDELLMVDSAYGPTRDLCDGWLARIGVTTRFYDPSIGGGIADLTTPATKLVWLESPGSMTFEMQDVPAIAAAARAAGAWSAIDNTWATPLLFPAMAHCDVSIMAGTKYVVGHADAMLGTATARGDAWRAIDAHARATGQHCAPDDAWLALRGLRTMRLRLTQHAANGLALARWLAARDDVGAVLHPALPDCPGHDLWARDCSGASGLFAFALKGASRAARDAFVDALHLFGIGYSWGGYESLAIPVDPVRVATPTRDYGGPLIRIHAGLEDAADLIADLERGFEAARR